MITPNVSRNSHSQASHLQEPNPKKWSITVTVSNVNIVKDRDFDDSDVLIYALVKNYSFGGSVIYPYAHTPIRPYAQSIASIPRYSLHIIYIGKFLHRHRLNILNFH